MKNLIYLSCLILFALIFNSCDKPDDNDIPECINVILEDFKTEACTGSGDLTTWDFNGREVYCFYYGDCIADSRADIYEKDCTLICSLFGLSGNRDCEGINWNINAVKLSTLYTH